jgi:PAS domain S-box-containing protein
MSDTQSFYKSIANHMRGFLYRSGGQSEGFRMQMITSGIERLTGYQASEFLVGGARSFATINVDHERVAEQIIAEKHFENRTGWDIQYRLRHRDGRLVPVHEVGSAVYADDGSIACLQGAIIDASEIEEAVHRANDQRKSLSALMHQTNAILTVLSQLSMLAYNARIEAQRAGNAGLGFTVIATEMKTIARHASELVEKIEIERQSISTELAV